MICILCVLVAFLIVACIVLAEILKRMPPVYLFAFLLIAGIVLVKILLS